jgi:hypothetical protein
MKILDILARLLPLPLNALVILCFFFSFFLVKCNESTLVSIEGIDLVVGSDMAAESELGEFFNQNTSNNEELELPQGDDQPISPHPLAIIALLMAVAGVMMVFLPWKQRNLLQMVLSIIGFLALLALIVLFRQQYADLGSNSGSEYQEKLLKGLNFKIEAGLGLIWSMVLFAVNGLFLGSCMYIQKQYANEEKVPDALQNVDNESANQLNV